MKQQTINFTELERRVAGDYGRIYISRRGTVTVFEMRDGTTYLCSNTGDSGVAVCPPESYWVHSIDWQAPPYFYWTFGVTPADEMPERSGMQLPLTQVWIDKIAQRRASARQRA